VGGRTGAYAEQQVAQKVRRRQSDAAIVQGLEDFDVAGVITEVGWRGGRVRRSGRCHGHAIAIGAMRNRSVANSVVGTDGSEPPVAHASTNKDKARERKQTMRTRRSQCGRESE
jgi:hypothetical protein